MNEFLDSIINTKDLSKDYPVVPSLIENNEKQINQLSKFFMNDKKFALVGGFNGSGKSQVVDFVVRNLKEDVLILHYTCFETTILDDMMLCFYERFRNYVLKGVIAQPKVKAENFTQMINSYFNSVLNPIVIVIDSYNSLVKENRTGILDFLKHLSKFPNVKIIILSSTFQQEVFSEFDYESVTILPFTQKLFEKYLKDNGIKNIGVFSNELYKISKGYYKNVEFAVNILKLRKLSLVKFMENYTQSYMSYSEFISRELLSFVDPVSAHLFRLLTVMRIPIHINLLKSLHLYNEEQIIFFIRNAILSYEGNSVYLKEDLREIIENQIPANVMIKLHRACIDLYNTQLPLKPAERDLLLSRQTMRNEIEYHSMFIPKRPVIPPKPVKKEIPEAKVPQLEEVNVQATDNQAAETIAPVEETKEDKINKISFIIEDESMLDNIAESINSFITTSAQTTQLEKESVSMSLTQLLNLANAEEKKYNYKRVILLYQTALTKTKEDDFYTFLPSIYIRLAEAYKQLSDLYNALEYYTQALDFYHNASNYNKVYEMKLEIANIYYAMYKTDNAKFILSELEKTENLSNELRIKVNLVLAKLSENPEQEYQYYKKSIPLVELKTDKAVISELYYKYAAASSEQDELRTSAQFYLKCIDLDNNPKNNPYISKALANLAELYDEIGSTKQAIQYYNESISIDLVMKNYNGLYVSASHLAEIYSASDANKSLEYYNKALEYAKQLNEPFYIVSTILDIADFYSLRRNFEIAYKNLIEAHSVAKTTLTQDNLDKINSMLDELKKRITGTDLMRFQAKYGK